MGGISGDTIEGFRNRLARFRAEYVLDWDDWLSASTLERPKTFGRILRNWQACRPNRMRRERDLAVHDPPFLEDLLGLAEPHVDHLRDFDLSKAEVELDRYREPLEALWDIFEALSYSGRARGGKAGSVGISKAVLLVTDGRVGPAFDSQVRRRLGLTPINDPQDWISALSLVNQDIIAFEGKNETILRKAAGVFGHLEVGRIYDMALGPG